MRRPGQIGHFFLSHNPETKNDNWVAQSPKAPNYRFLMRVGVGWGGVGWGGEMVLHLRFPCYKLQIKFTNLDHVIK